MSNIIINSSTSSVIVLTDASNSLYVTPSGSINVGLGYCVAVQTSNSVTSSIIIDGSLNNTIGYGIQIGNPPTSGYLNILTINPTGKIVSVNENIYCFNGNTIETLTVFGIITSLSFNNIKNIGTINTLNNLQSGLTYSTNLPINYNIVINSLSQYGQLFYDISSVSLNPMIFNIYNTSSLNVGTYSDVITGLDEDKVTNTSGTFANFNWKLVFITNGESKVFNLIVTEPSCGVLTPQTAACTSQCGGPQPPRLWYRGTLSCIPLTATITQRDLDMRRKTEILKYKANSAQLTKKQKWSQMVRGNGPLAKKVWANQNILGSNPNVDKLPLGPGNTLICNSEPIRCSLSTECDVPGPPTLLCDDPNIPLVNYIVQRTYLAGGTKFPQTCWEPGDDGFPVGKAGSDIVCPSITLSDIATFNGFHWDLNATTTILACQTLTIDTELNILPGQTLTNNGVINGTVINGETLINNGTITQVVNYSGTVNNNGKINNLNNQDFVNNNPGGIILLSENTGSIENDNGGIINNLPFCNNLMGGIIYNYGTINNTGTLQNFDSAKINNFGGTINNTGTIYIYDNGEIDNGGTINNIVGTIYRGDGTGTCGTGTYSGTAPIGNAVQIGCPPP